MASEMLLLSQQLKITQIKTNKKKITQTKKKNVSCFKSKGSKSDKCVKP